MNCNKVILIKEMTNLENDMIELVNVEEMNQAHPVTYQIPSNKIRKNLPIGALVKIIAVMAPQTERFWVEITERNSEDGRVRYYGVLRNNLMAGYVFGSKIGPFEPMHVLDIFKPTKENLARQLSIKTKRDDLNNVAIIPENVSKYKQIGKRRLK